MGKRDRPVEISQCSHPCVVLDALIGEDTMIYLGENKLVVDTELNFIEIEMHTISLRQAMHAQHEMDLEEALPSHV